MAETFKKSVPVFVDKITKLSMEDLYLPTVRANGNAIAAGTGIAIINSPLVYSLLRLLHPPTALGVPEN